MQVLIKEILRQIGTVVEYSDVFKSLFGIISLLSDMVEDETHFVDFVSLRDYVRKLEVWFKVLDDDCKETESRASGMDGDNELVDNVTGETVEESFKVENRLVDDVRCDKMELKVSEMDDNSNLKEVEKESIESMGYEECCEKNVNVKGKEIECVNLIALDELCGGKVKGIEMELDDLVESNEGLGGNGEILEGELKTLTKHHLAQNSNSLRTKSGGVITSYFDQVLAYGMMSKIKMSDLDENSLSVDLGTAKLNEVSLSYLEYGSGLW
ncbi:hypothetical protein Tco_1003871 [Tanacetum coccineum]|uniref:Uncharacterized protein n=1 Tax=Tanacetum coccineum TaxID=301880 RepID=A0ABQ5FBM4_9ASTR